MWAHSSVVERPLCNTDGGGSIPLPRVFYTLPLIRGRYSERRQNILLGESRKREAASSKKSFSIEYGFEFLAESTHIPSDEGMDMRFEVYLMNCCCNKLYREWPGFGFGPWQAAICSGQTHAVCEPEIVRCPEMDCILRELKHLSSGRKRNQLRLGQ